MKINEEYLQELKEIGREIEKIYDSSKEKDTFKIIDKIVDKYCDPIDIYNIMYISDCVLYMNYNWAKDFIKEVREFSLTNNIIG
jgi:hypothetical protein